MLNTDMEGDTPLKNVAVAQTGEINSSQSDTTTEEQQPTRVAGKLDVLIQGVALFSDGYNSDHRIHEYGPSEAVSETVERERQDKVIQLYSCR